MKFEIKIKNWVVFDLTFFNRENSNTFYYFGFMFLFFGVYLWYWSNIDNVFSFFVQLPFTSKIIAFEKYFNKKSK